MNQDLISRRLKIIRDLEAEKDKISKAKQDMLDNDEHFAQVKEKNTQHREALKELKVQIEEKAHIKEINMQLKDKVKEIKELKEILSQELADYYKNEGTMQIEDAEGNIKRLKFNVSLVN